MTITVVGFAGSARGPIITNESRDAITLLSPCRDPRDEPPGLKNSAATCRTSIIFDDLLTETSRIIKDVVHDVPNVFFGQEFAKFRHYWTVPS